MGEAHIKIKIPNFAGGLVDATRKAKSTDDNRTKCTELVNFYSDEGNNLRQRPPVEKIGNKKGVIDIHTSENYHYILRNITDIDSERLNSKVIDIIYRKALSTRLVNNVETPNEFDNKLDIKIIDIVNNIGDEPVKSFLMFTSEVTNTEGSSNLSEVFNYINNKILVAGGSGSILDLTTSSELLNKVGNKEPPIIGIIENPHLDSFDAHIGYFNLYSVSLDVDGVRFNPNDVRALRDAYENATLTRVALNDSRSITNIKSLVSFDNVSIGFLFGGLQYEIKNTSIKCLNDNNSLVPQLESMSPSDANSYISEDYMSDDVDLPALVFSINSLDATRRDVHTAVLNTANKRDLINVDNGDIPTREKPISIYTYNKFTSVRPELSKIFKYIKKVINLGDENKGTPFPDLKALITAKDVSLAGKTLRIGGQDNLYTQALIMPSIEGMWFKRSDDSRDADPSSFELVTISETSPNGRGFSVGGKGVTVGLYKSTDAITEPSNNSFRRPDELLYITLDYNAKNVIDFLKDVPSFSGIMAGGVNFRQIMATRENTDNLELIPTSTLDVVDNILDQFSGLNDNLLSYPIKGFDVESYFRRKYKYTLTNQITGAYDVVDDQGWNTGINVSSANLLIDERVRTSSSYSSRYSSIRLYTVEADKKWSKAPIGINSYIIPDDETGKINVKNYRDDLSAISLGTRLVDNRRDIVTADAFAKDELSRPIALISVPLINEAGDYIDTNCIIDSNGYMTEARTYEEGSQPATYEVTSAWKSVETANLLKPSAGSDVPEFAVVNTDTIKKILMYDSMAGSLKVFNVPTRSEVSGKSILSLGAIQSNTINNLGLNSPKLAITGEGSDTLLHIVGSDALRVYRVGRSFGSRYNINNNSDLGASIIGVSSEFSTGSFASITGVTATIKGRERTSSNTGSSVLLAQNTDNLSATGFLLRPTIIKPCVGELSGHRLRRIIFDGSYANFSFTSSEPNFVRMFSNLVGRRFASNSEYKTNSLSAEGNGFGGYFPKEDEVTAKSNGVVWYSAGDLSLDQIGGVNEKVTSVTRGFDGSYIVTTTGGVWAVSRSSFATTPIPVKISQISAFAPPIGESQVYITSSKRSVMSLKYSEESGGTLANVSSAQLRDLDTYTKSAKLISGHRLMFLYTGNSKEILVIQVQGGGEVIGFSKFTFPREVIFLRELNNDELLISMKNYPLCKMNFAINNDTIYRDDAGLFEANTKVEDTNVKSLLTTMPLYAMTSEFSSTDSTTSLKGYIIGTTGKGSLKISFNDEYTGKRGKEVLLTLRPSRNILSSFHSGITSIKNVPRSSSVVPSITIVKDDGIQLSIGELTIDLNYNGVS